MYVYVYIYIYTYIYIYIIVCWLHYNCNHVINSCKCIVNRVVSTVALATLCIMHLQCLIDVYHVRKCNTTNMQ